MNAEWKGLRREIPWVDRPPMDIIRDHFRFSIAPIDAGPPQEMAKIIRWMDTEDILMFATDYPHMHNDERSRNESSDAPSTRAHSQPTA